MRRWVLLFLTACAVAGPVRAMPAGVEEVFASELEAFARDDQHQRPPSQPVLFVGSSSIRLWTHLGEAFPGRPVINRGFGGSTMADLVRLQDRLVLPYQPRAVVVYEGDNDLNRGTTVDGVLGHFEQFLRKLEWDLPGTAVILLAVKPSPSRKALLPLQRELNSRLVALAQHHPEVAVVDTFTPLLDARGEPDPRWFQSDGLHLNPEGYALWIPAIRSTLDSVLGRNRTPARTP